MHVEFWQLVALPQGGQAFPLHWPDVTTFLSLADPSPGVYNEVVVPATYSSFLYCGPISNKAGPPPPRRGRDGERGAKGWEGMSRSQDGWECSLEG